MMMIIIITYVDRGAGATMGSLQMGMTHHDGREGNAFQSLHKPAVTTNVDFRN